MKISNQIFRKFRAVTAVFLSITVFAAFTITEPADALTGEHITVNTPSREEIVLYSQLHPTDLAEFDSQGNHKSGYTTGYSEKPVTAMPYTAGSLSDSELICALNTVKTIRYIAGISDEIYLSSEYNEMAQTASLVNYVNGSVSHSPTPPAGMDYSLASKGVTGSKNSNIARYSKSNMSLKWVILDGWMEDSDAGNLSTLGHRRWILNPSMGMTGFGSVTDVGGTYSAMYCMDKSNTDNAYTGVAWPAANTPLSYFTINSPWSISLGKDLDESQVSVSLVRLRGNDSHVWNFNSLLADGDFYVSNAAYGQKGCIIFRPEGIDEYREDDFYYVSVTIGEENFNYNVTFFDLEGYYSTEAPMLKSAKLNSLNKPAIRWADVEGAESYNIYRKARGGSWKLLASGLDDLSYEDASAGKGIRYYYKVTTTCTVNGTEYESDDSSSKYVNVPLSKPRITSIKSTAKRTNYIKWSSVSKAKGYKVYRRVAGTSTWKLVKTTSNKYYKDTKLTSGRKYEYKVRAYRTMNGYTRHSSYSAVKSVRTR